MRLLVHTEYKQSVHKQRRRIHVSHAGHVLKMFYLAIGLQMTNEQVSENVLIENGVSMKKK